MYLKIITRLDFGLSFPQNMALVYGLVNVANIFGFNFSPPRPTYFQGCTSGKLCSSPKKRARQNVKARKHNASLRSMVRTYIKRTVNTIAAGDYAVGEAYKTAVPVIDHYG